MQVAIIDKLEERLAKEAAPPPITEVEWERIVLVHALTYGKVYASKAGPEIQKRLRPMAERGFLQPFDRLGQALELTPAGHRHLATLCPEYEPPAGLFMMDRWSDPEALVCQAAALLAGKLGIKREPGYGTEGRTVSPEAAALLIEEAKRLAGK